MHEDVRVLVVLNEAVPLEAIDWYRALGRLQSQGRIEAWSVYPFLARRVAGLGESEMMREIVTASADLGATVVLWAHFSGAEVSDASMARMRPDAGGVAHGYWDGDGYHFYRHPFPREALRLCAKCDAVFVNAGGYIARLLRTHGCRDVRYVPSTGDERFTAQPLRTVYDLDVAMIGSCIRRRLPLGTYPGNVVRRRLVSAFSKRYGSRFGVFGSGWSGPNAMGPVQFASQSEVYGRALVALGNNNLFAPYCFSNRLPIAMQSGRPLVYNTDEGYEEVFGADPGVHWFGSVDDALRLTDALLADPEAALADAEKARRLAEDRFTTYHSLGYMIRVLNAKRGAHDGAAEIIGNPWMDREYL